MLVFVCKVRLGIYWLSPYHSAILSWSVHPALFLLHTLWICAACSVLLLYYDLPLICYMFCVSVSGAVSDSYWSGVSGLGVTFFFFFKADLISAHFLCGVNGSCTSWLWKENKTGAIADMQTSGRLCTQCHLRAGRPIRTGNNHYAPLPLWLQFVLNCLTCHLAFLVFPVPPKPLLSTRCTGVNVLLVKTAVVMRWVWSQFWRR